MKDYTIVANSSERFLAQGIRELITKGWVPVGGLCVRTTGPETAQFYQAMGLEDVPVKEKSVDAAKVKKQESQEK